MVCWVGGSGSGSSQSKQQLASCSVAKTRGGLRARLGQRKDGAENRKRARSAGRKRGGENAAQPEHQIETGRCSEGARQRAGRGHRMGKGWNNAPMMDSFWFLSGREERESDGGGGGQQRQAEGEDVRPAAAGMLAVCETEERERSGAERRGRAEA